MNFVQFHIGDWDSSTRLLSPLEKGIYIDLLFLYYSLERPLMRSECEGIARAYTDEEKTALEFVLNRFFSTDGDVYRQRRCDQEIEAVHAKSMKAAASAKARWDREKSNSMNRQRLSEQMQTECERNADALKTNVQDACKRNANAMLTDNRKPITITKEEKVEKETKKTKREPTVFFPGELPEDWRKDALVVRPDVTPEKVFLKLRSRYAPTTMKKTIGMWRRIYLDWGGREYPDGKIKANVPDHKNNNLRFDDGYYADAKLPDGSIDWGI